MEKESTNFSDKIKGALEQKGFKATVITIKFDPEITRAVTKFVSKIETAHQKAAHSTLHFPVLASQGASQGWSLQG